MEDSLSAFKYALKTFRSNRYYLLFQVAQLLLAVAIVMIALNSARHFRTPTVLVMQFLLFSVMAFDLLVVKWQTQGRLLNQWRGMFELAFLTFFAGTLLFLSLPQIMLASKDYRQIVQEEDELILCLLIFNYAVQIGRSCLAIRQSHANCLVQDCLINADLNQQVQVSVVLYHLDDTELQQKIANNRKQTFEVNLPIPTDRNLLR